MDSSSRNFLSNNTGSFNVTNNYTTDDEKSRILSWISPLESWKRHSDVARARAKGVGDWVLQSSEFQAWRQDGNDASVGRILFGRGAPGAGKTFVCSLVVDTLCDESAGLNVAVGCLYCDYRGQKEQTPEVMIGSLLRQFALPEIPEAIKQAFRVARPHLGGRAPELAKIIELFPAVLKCFDRVFICVDALDEFFPDYRVGFLRSLHQVLEESPNTRLFLTARPHIRSVIRRNIPLDMSTVTIQPVFGDIELYLATKLNTDPHHEAMDDGLKSEILTKILKESSEIFLLVALQVDSILGEVTIGRRREKLLEMTSDLGDSYTATLERVRGQHGALAMLGISALMWISLAERPLHIDELCHALAVNVGSPKINTEMVPEIETVVASCMGLVTIDHASSTVRLVHATLEEYLRSHQGEVFQNAHAIIAEVCLSYLGIQQVRELPSDFKMAPPASPLLVYASCYWGAHARKEFTASVRHLALGILQQYPQHAAANIFLFNGGAPWYWQHSSAGFSGLHYVSYFGVDELLEALLSIEKVSLNLADEWGRTPLILAIEKGNIGVARILISCADVNPNLGYLDGQTPLFLASKIGHEGVVRALLDRADVNPNSADRYCQTPLSVASEIGHEGIVRALLHRTDVSPNLVDRQCQTPLSRASKLGHEGVVRTLLVRADVNPNSSDLHLQTSLFHASRSGHEGVVRALLDRADVNPNLVDRYCQTPLFVASEIGHEGIVRALLHRCDINPNLADQHLQTPLSRASKIGHEGVVRILLDRADINPNSADLHLQTPLFHASGNGHEEVVRALLDHTDVNPNPPNRDGRTPLFVASQNGHEGVTRILLSCANINPDSADWNGQTPLFRASARGHAGVVVALLSRNDVNPNFVDIFGHTALHTAASSGHHAIVNLLQARQ